MKLVVTVFTGTIAGVFFVIITAVVIAATVIGIMWSKENCLLFLLWCISSLPVDIITILSCSYNACIGKCSNGQRRRKHKYSYSKSEAEK